MRKIVSIILCALSIGGFATRANAVLIDVVPPFISAGVGDSFDVDLTVSGLGNGFAPSLGAFDADILFDPALIGFSGAVFGPSLGDPLLGEADTGADASTPGIVKLFEVSFLEADSTSCTFCVPPFLNDIQTDGFVLATLSFNILAAGTSSIIPTNIILSDALGDVIDAVTGTGATIIVPEPSTLLLFALGFISLGFWIRRRERRGV